MRRTKALALFTLVAVSFTALPGESKAAQNPVIAGIETKVYADTLPAISEDPSNLLPQNLIYKKRLDSIQKTIPLPYNSYVQEYIDIYMARKKEIGKMLGLSRYYFPVYEQALKTHGVPDELKFLSIVESSLDPNAVSRSGAVGLWQFMYTTALGYGLKMDRYSDERRDPIASSYAAAHYFRNAFDKFGDWLLAIAAYNCGEGAIERAIVKAGGVKDFWQIREFLPAQTRNYVPAFIATTYMMRYFNAYDIVPVPSDMPDIIDVVQVNRLVSLESVAKASGLDIQRLVILNPSYKKLIINGTPESPKTLIVPLLNKELYEGMYAALNPIKDEVKFLSASTKEISEPVRKKAAYHKVRSGENLSVIANRYDIEVQDLKVWNKLKTLTVVPGQRLKVSSGKPVQGFGLLP